MLEQREYMMQMKFVKKCFKKNNLGQMLYVFFKN